MIVYREVSTLAKDLGVRAETLYAVSNSLPGHYRQVALPKGDGTDRRLLVPDEVLKGIQRRIDRRLLAYMPVSPYAAAYRCGGGIGPNARPHVGQPMVLKLDIRGFFDSVLYSTVKERVFPAQRFSEPVRILLTILCYYKDALPQGAPTSPAISNIILREFDETVGAWCRERGIAYTRYCDDMTFSGSLDAGEVTAFVRGELRAMGFFLNDRKTRLLRAGQRQTVTGLVVNERMGVSPQYRRRLRQELYYCKKFGVEEHLARTGCQETAAAYRRSLLGRVNFVLQFSPEDREMRSYRDWLLAQLRQAN